MGRSGVAFRQGSPYKRPFYRQQQKPRHVGCGIYTAIIQLPKRETASPSCRLLCYACQLSLAGEMLGKLPKLVNEAWHTGHHNAGNRERGRETCAIGDDLSMLSRRAVRKPSICLRKRLIVILAKIVKRLREDAISTS